MGKPASALARLRRLVKEDPRSAILLHEILGPPPGLVPPRGEEHIILPGLSEKPRAGS